MCGIFALLNNTDIMPTAFVNEQFQKGKGRGPEFSVLTQAMIKVQLGFHRLAINGLNAESNQPIIIDDISLVCNGEIYNYKELYKLMGMDEAVETNTDSDCEVIIHLYMRYGIEETLQLLDGVFSFVLIDYRITEPDSKMYIARDPYGVRPLYILKPTVQHSNQSNGAPIFAVASELKMLRPIATYVNMYDNERFDRFNSLKLKNKTILPPPVWEYTVEQFQPGTYSVFELSFKVSAFWKESICNQVYHRMAFPMRTTATSEENIIKNIQLLLVDAVEKRCSTTDRPIACLLSGGLDSSLIAALVTDYHKKHNLPMIETYSIGLEGSVDLKYAKIVADYLGTKHTEIVITEKEYLDAIPQVIQAIESYDTTTVRASVGNWLLGKRISEISQAKVIFNGDGSDELAGGYLYFSKAPNSAEFDKECRRLLKDIYLFDVLRSDKSISSHGLEPRTPFLDRAWTQYYLSIPTEIRWLKSVMEKHWIRTAFSSAHFLNSEQKPLLPDEILWRRKEAFSDGVTQVSRSLPEIINEYASEQFNNIDNKEYPYQDDTNHIFEHIAKVHPNMSLIHGHLLPKTAEQYYYRKWFETFYPGMGHVLPYFWMPKYVDAKDASARTLDIYSETKEK